MTPSTYGAVATTLREPATCSMPLMSVSSSFSLFLVTVTLDETFSLPQCTAPQLVFLSLSLSAKWQSGGNGANGELVLLAVSAGLEGQQGGQ